MGVVSVFLHRFLAPFATGICMAAATVVGNVVGMAVLLIAAAVFGYASLPVGGRMIARLTGGPF